MSRRWVLLVATMVLLGGQRIGAEDWPEFRGPTGQGTYHGPALPTEWSTSKNVAWNTAIPGKGWSSPVVSAGRVFLTTSVPAAGSKDQTLQALCLSADTGKIFWETEVFHQDGAKTPGIHNKNSHASSTPVVEGGRLYVHFGYQGTACLNLDGKILWRDTTQTFVPVHGNGGSPIVVDDALIFSRDGRDQRSVTALDKNTGKVLWNAERQGEASRKFSFSTPLAITVQGRKQIISAGSDVVSALDPANGREIWRVRYSGYSVIPRPVFAHGLVFMSTGFNVPTLLAIRPDGDGDVTDTHVAWSTRKSGPYTPSMLVVGDMIYMVSDSGMATCLDARDGTVHWQQRLSGSYSASPLAANGTIYFQSEQGTGTVIKAGKTFEVIAKNSLEERTLASYGAADGALYIRTATRLYRIQQH